MTHVICPLKTSRFSLQKGTQNGGANDIVRVHFADGFTRRY